MPATLPNTTTTDDYKDVELGGNSIYDHGVLLVANNPVSILIQHGPDRGTPSETEYPYVTPTVLPLVRGEREYIVGLRIKSALLGVAAQVSGYLVEPGVAGLGVGSAFTSTVLASGAVETAGLTVQAATQGAALTLAAGGQVALPGCSLTFTVNGNNSSVSILFSARLVSTVVGYGLVSINPYLDGAPIGLPIEFNDIGINIRETLSNFHRISISSGTHTIDLRGNKNIAAGTIAADIGELILLLNDA